jgi:hypothetical protein
MTHSYIYLFLFVCLVGWWKSTINELLYKLHK